MPKPGPRIISRYGERFTATAIRVGEHAPHGLNPLDCFCSDCAIGLGDPEDYWRWHD